MVKEVTHEDKLPFSSYSTEDISLSKETVFNSFPTINGECMLSMPPAWAANLLRVKL